MKKILLLVVAATAALPAVVLAQGQVRESIPAAPFLAGAYAFM